MKRSLLAIAVVLAALSIPPAAFAHAILQASDPKAAVETIVAEIAAAQRK